MYLAAAAAQTCEVRSLAGRRMHMSTAILGERVRDGCFRRSAEPPASIFLSCTLTALSLSLSLSGLHPQPRAGTSHSRKRERRAEITIAPAGRAVPQSRAGKWSTRSVRAGNRSMRTRRPSCVDAVAAIRSSPSPSLHSALWSGHDRFFTAYDQPHPAPTPTPTDSEKKNPHVGSFFFPSFFVFTYRAYICIVTYIICVPTHPNATQHNLGPWLEDRDHDRGHGHDSFLVLTVRPCVRACVCACV